MRTHAVTPGAARSPRRVGQRSSSPVTGAAAVLRLQRLAGNAAVRTLLTRRGGLTVHRCGPVPCDCPAEERAAAAAPVQRQAAPAPAPAPQFGEACRHPNPCRHDRCTQDQHTTIGGDIDRTIGHVDAAIGALQAMPLDDKTARALDWFYTDHSQDTVDTVRTRLECIRECLTDTQGNNRWGCHPDDDNNAYVCIPADAGFCSHVRTPVCVTDNYFGNGDRRRAETILHECGHREGLSISRNPRSVPDIYTWKLRFLSLSTADALRNADSYALFASAITQGIRLSRIPTLQVSSGVALPESGEATWFARLYVGAEFQHPVLGMFNPTLGIGMSVIGEPVTDTPSPVQANMLLSLLPGVRISPPRPGEAGSGYASLFGGPSVVIHPDGVNPGAEAGVNVGYRWRWLDVSGGIGYVYDPGGAAGQRNLVTVGGAVTFTMGDIGR